MIKALDYYYLVLLREFGVMSVTTLMGVTFTVNVLSLAILFNNHILEKDMIGIIGILVLGFMSSFAFDIRYNKKRRERLIEKYKDENLKSRQQGKVKVIVYVVLSIVLLIFSLTLLERPNL